jgi:hypothetical protein
MSMTAEQSQKAFALRMELSQASIPWRACYPSGDDFVRFATVSEAGIKMLIGDYPDAIETGIFVAGRLVRVASLEAVRKLPWCQGPIYKPSAQPNGRPRRGPIIRSVEGGGQTTCKRRSYAFPVATGA